MSTNALNFVVGDYVVYPKHGVGRVIELQSSEIAGMKLELYVLRFEKEKMTLRVPTNKAESVGMRKLSSDKAHIKSADPQGETIGKYASMLTGLDIDAGCGVGRPAHGRSRASRAPPATVFVTPSASTTRRSMPSSTCLPTACCASGICTG